MNQPNEKIWNDEIIKNKHFSSDIPERAGLKFQRLGEDLNPLGYTDAPPLSLYPTNG